MNLLALAMLGCRKDAPGDAGPETVVSTTPTPPTSPHTSTAFVPGFVAPWVRDERWSPGSITFTELAYHPVDTPEWLELHNPMALDLDLSGWSLEGAVEWTFPEGTWLAAGGYLVVSADPDALAASGYEGALGPFTGALDDAGDELQLTSNGGRRIDALTFGDDDPWPVGADGTGATLTKVRDLAASAHAENWRASPELGGTPGAPSDPLAPAPVRIDEVAAASDPFWVELLAVGDADLDGLVLTTPFGEEVLAGALADGDRLVVEGVEAPEPGDVVALLSADGAELLDAVRVSDRVRGRSAAGRWQWPTQPTPGEPNVLALTSDVVVNEVMYHHAPDAVDGQPVVDRDDEWIELYNRGSAEVDLEGWQLTDAVTFRFPPGTTLGPSEYLVVASDAAAFAQQHPGVEVLGDLEGRLDNATDRVLLLDANGNPADEVRYFHDGRWPEAADGGGSSLERRDPWADPAAAEAWAASDESARSQWVDVSYDAQVGSSPVGPDGVWEELVLGLLDAGEVLLDDVSVVWDPMGAAVELVQDGSFDDTARWRIIGNHRHSKVVQDPQGTGSVLHLVATGPTEHMHNHAETTLTRDITPGTYRISYRGRWLSGSNQLNTRLYFNRGARTVLLPMPEASGTPGAPNSTATEDLGPTFADFGQDVAVPAPGQPVTISARISDPDGVVDATLWASVDGAAFTSLAMTELDGRYSATVDGQPAGAIVQVYVEATDSLGAVATFPAAGPDSRALVQVDDGEAATNGLHDLRIVMTEADADWLHDEPNLMSNDLVGATVIYDETEVFYDVGVRTKGSQRGRPETVRLGYGLRFATEQPLRGTHTSVLIDRSEGVNFGQREVLVNLVAGRAGLVSAEYNDLVHVVTPRDEHTGPAELQLDRFTDLVLEAQFGDEGQLHDYELVYYPYTTVSGDPEGQKLPQPDGVIGTPITDLGSDPEAYRWTFGLQNQRREDDYDAIITLCQTFALSDPAMRAAAPSVIDVDLWLRSSAFAALVGAVDNYGGDGAQHNAAFYFRPDDGLALYFPHDQDFFGGHTGPVVGNNDVARLLGEPAWHRAYYQHLQDLLERAWHRGAIDRWCDQLGALLPDQDFASHCDFVEDRGAWVASGAGDAITNVYPPRPFGITTNGGADFETGAATVTLEGQGWIDVREIHVGGVPQAVTWLDATTWQIVVPLVPGPNVLSLTAWDLGGAAAGSDEIEVTYL